MITIHEKTAKTFDTFGLGALVPSHCVVEEELNGAYELEMKHPYDEGGKWKRIERGRIIYASASRGKQPFRIYYVKPSMKEISVNARHIFYDLLDNRCEPISHSGTATAALTAMQADAQKLLDEGCDIPSINIKVDFVALEKTVEYREYAVLEEVFLGDMVTVINTKMGFQKQAKVISYEWDCLLEQYNDVELGDFIPTLAASVTSGVKSGSLASTAYINAASVMTLLQQHLNDFNNPHHVTAAQVQG